MTLLLRVKPNGNAAFDYRSVAEVVIGRAPDVDLSIPDDAFLSKRHARMFLETGEWFVEDLDSRNATLLNGRRLAERSRLRRGDVLRLSDCYIEVKGAAPGSNGDAEVYRPAAAVLSESDSTERFIESDGDPELKRYAERLALLNRLHRSLASRHTSEALFDLILDAAFEQLDAEEGVIFLEGPEGAFHAAARRRRSHLTGDYLYSTQLFERVARQGMAALIRDVRGDDTWADARSLITQGIRSIVAAPLEGANGQVGMVVLSTQAMLRRFDRDDLELLVSLASLASLKLRNLELHAEASRRRELQKEIDLARKIQVALFPDALPRLEGYELFASNRPSRTVSGDLYRIDALDEGDRCALFVADVSGKGIGASLLTASLEALASGPIESGRCPGEVFRRLSRRLYARTPIEKFATAFFATLEADTGTLRYASAGHNPALVVRENGRIDALGATGVPLGIEANADYETAAVTLEPSETLIIYTDGLVEASDPRGEEYGMDRLLAIGHQHHSLGARELARAIGADLDAFTRKAPLDDDRTLVIARRQP